MESTGRLASPFADGRKDGLCATARQHLSDFWRWDQRIEEHEPNGNVRTVWAHPKPLRNPISTLALLSRKDWLLFAMGFAAWTADAFDFHSLSIQQVKLATYFQTTKTNISIAITCTLLLRSVGAAIFGLLADRFGRKWPMVFNMIGLGLLQLGTIYAENFQVFVAIRSLFGILMGGVYGGAAAQALENVPAEARGLVSGIYQQGYALGYVLAAIANLAVGGGTDSWKTVFWAGAGVSIGIGVLRAFFPESKQFIEAKKARKAGAAKSSGGKFLKQVKTMLALEWMLSIYCIILMTWFNFYSHTSQDSYTTFMLVEKELDNSGASRASILMKVGACVGGPVMGWLSQYVGRRRTIAFCALMSAVLIPAWILPNDEPSLSASGFFIQFLVQGAFGVIPIHLNELSPPQFRSSFPGITYQLGNMISSPAAQIVNTISERTFIKNRYGKIVEAYGPVMGVATAIIAAGIAVTVLIGPERRGRHFEQAGAAGVEMTERGAQDQAVVSGGSGTPPDDKGASAVQPTARRTSSSIRRCEEGTLGGQDVRRDSGFAPHRESGQSEQQEGREHDVPLAGQFSKCDNGPKDCQQMDAQTGHTPTPSTPGLGPASRSVEGR